MVIGWPTEGPTRIWVGIAWIWSGLFVAITLSSSYRRPSNWRKQAWLQQFIRSRTISKRQPADCDCRADCKATDGKGTRFSRAI